jgi:hypothetical protein
MLPTLLSRKFRHCHNRSRGVQDAFALSLATMWQVMAGLFGAGLLVSLLIKSIPMHSRTDENWGFEDKPKPSMGEELIMNPVNDP